LLNLQNYCPQGQPGSGLEFLQFHRDFINKVLQWYFQQLFADPNAVAPWHSIPNELKEARLGWNNRWVADEHRIVSFDPPFASADDFGIFIETGIHNSFLHAATADFFNEPTVSTLHSPESTFFYKIHGLVDFWWRQGQGFGNLADGRPIWIGNFSRTDRAEVLFYFRGDGRWWLGTHDGNQFVWNLIGNTGRF
jgi:hypothetical protein